MKKLLYMTFLSIILFSSCTMYKTGMEQAQYDPIPERLGNLDYHFTSENVSGGNPQFIDNIVQSEIRKNIISEGDGKITGNISVNCNKMRIKQNLFLAGLSGGTFFSLNLLGMPITTSKAEIGLEFKIKDVNNKTIKTYTYAKKGSAALGFYYGKNVNVLVVDITKELLKQFKTDLERDASYVLAQLKNTSNETNTYVAKSDERSYSLEELQALGVVGGNRQQNVQQTSTSSNALEQQSAPQRVLSDVDQNIPVTKRKAENTFVLIIANEDYQFVDDVDFAVNDGKTFKEYCVKTLGVPEKQVWLHENASYGVINAGVSKMVQAMDFFDKPNAIIYYCGHGIPDEKTGDAYIIPTDGNGKDMATCYSLNKLYTTFANTKAEKITYFMDACFTGASKEGSMLVAARGVAREPKKETLSGKSVVFSATSSDETAMAYKEKQHGLFTYFLLKKLQETKGNVSYSELQEYIKQNVKKESFLTNEKPQTPVVATSPEVQESWKTMTLK